MVHKNKFHFSLSAPQISTGHFPPAGFCRKREKWLLAMRPWVGGAWVLGALLLTCCARGLGGLGLV